MGAAAGPMREPLSAIRRADAVILMAFGEDAANGGTLPDHAVFEGKAIMRAALRAASLVHAEHGEWREGPIDLAGRRIAIVSGLADAAGFHAMVRALGAEICATLDYRDHHDYSLGDWENIQAAARGAQLLLTTEKDLVKLEKFCSGAIPLYALRVQVVMEESDEARLLAMIMERARHRGVAPSPPTNSLRGGLH